MTRIGTWRKTTYTKNEVKAGFPEVRWTNVTPSTDLVIVIELKPSYDYSYYLVNIYQQTRDYNPYDASIGYREVVANLKFKSKKEAYDFSYEFMKDHLWGSPMYISTEKDSDTRYKYQSRYGFSL